MSFGSLNKLYGQHISQPAGLHDNTEFLPLLLNDEYCFYNISLSPCHPVLVQGVWKGTQSWNSTANSRPDSQRAGLRIRSTRSGTMRWSAGPCRQGRHSWRETDGLRHHGRCILGKVLLPTDLTELPSKWGWTIATSCFNFALNVVEIQASLSTHSGSFHKYNFSTCTKYQTYEYVYIITIIQLLDFNLLK